MVFIDNILIVKEFEKYDSHSGGIYADFTKAERFLLYLTRQRRIYSELEAILDKFNISIRKDSSIEISKEDIKRLNSLIKYYLKL